MSKPVTVAVLKQLAEKNPLAKSVFKSWLLREKPRDAVVLRRVKEELKEIHVVASYDDINALLDQFQTAGLGKITGKDYQRKLTLSMPMKALIDLLRSDATIAEAHNQFQAMKAQAKQAKRPDMARVLESVARTRTLSVPLDRNRSVGIDLPERFTAEDAELLAQFIRRQASE
jgi:hypothetical protein